MFQSVAVRLRNAAASRSAPAGIPLTDYNTELLPLSIGTRSKRVSARGTLNYQSEPGWFVNGTRPPTRGGAQTCSSTGRTTITNGEFFMSDHVDMPNVTDYDRERRLHEAAA